MLRGTSSAKKTTIDAGAGNDTVRLAPGIIGGNFRLSAKSGDDDVPITGGQFADKTGLDGGQGTDALSLSTGSFSVPPAIHGFEQ